METETLKQPGTFILSPVIIQDVEGLPLKFFHCTVTYWKDGKEEKMDVCSESFESDKLISKRCAMETFYKTLAYILQWGVFPHDTLRFPPDVEGDTPCYVDAEGRRNTITGKSLDELLWIEKYCWLPCCFSADISRGRHVTAATQSPKRLLA